MAASKLATGLSALLLLLLATAASVYAEEKVPLLVDTDLGNDIDDAFALALLLASPEVDIRGVTATGADAETRAWMVCRLLTAVGRRDVPVAWGRDPQPGQPVTDQAQYRRHPALLFNRMARPVKETAVELLHSRLKASPGKLTLLALGPLTNVARLLSEHPDCKPWIKRIVLMGGALHVGYSGEPPAEPEWNVRTDVAAARAVFAAGVPLTVAPLDATVSLKLEEPLRRRIFGACTPLTYQVQALYQLWDKPTPTMFDPLAAALCFEERFCRLQDLCLDMHDRGQTRIVEGKPNARVATSVRGEEFLEWLTRRLSAGDPVLPRPAANVTALVPRGNMPNRVHVAEDYETDIEKRWWMSGKAETADVPAGSRRACRGVLTQDFDDRMGDLKTMYNAVIFNPVPGPPMGKNPRLAFRYRLQGTDTLRVQIFSLTNGYHRHLTLTGLPQGRWESAAVDMTVARRPDGSGGPLSENERIDDVQFYADPRAELLIDDIVLYDAAAADEKRPFPRRVLFTGWFDTGKQGQEWPGDFEIVDKRGSFWKAARSVEEKKLGKPWVRLHLRGERPHGEQVRLLFRYRLADADALRVTFLHNASGTHHTVELKGLEKGKWAEATADFAGNTQPGQIDEVHWLLPRGAELLLDDVLLYEP